MFKKFSKTLFSTNNLTKNRLKMVSSLSRCLSQVFNLRWQLLMCVGPLSEQIWSRYGGADVRLLCSRFRLFISLAFSCGCRGLFTSCIKSKSQVPVPLLSSEKSLNPTCCSSTRFVSSAKSLTTHNFALIKILDWFQRKHRLCELHTLQNLGSCSEKFLSIWCT